MALTAPKKMAFLITSTGWGGLEMNVVKLAKAFGEKGHEVALITQEESTINQNGSDAFHSTILINRKRKYFDFKAAKRIASELKALDINLLMVCDNRDLDMACWAKRRHMKTLRIIYHQQMQIGMDKKSPIHTLRYNSIDRWIAPLPYLKKEVGKRTRFDSSKVRIVPLCVDLNRFDPNKYSMEAAREKLGLSPSAPMLGIIGRISEKKGQRFMVEAIKELREEGAAIELLVFGSATVNDPDCQAYDVAMRKYVMDNKLEDNVHFRPHQEDVAQFYNAVDVFALGSHSETFGMVTVEAMLAALPIIATTSGGTSDLLDNGEIGQLYIYEDKEGFKRGVHTLLADLDKAKRIGEKAREKAFREYTLETEVSGILGVMAEVSSSS